jgi:hypothetical protein
MTYAHTCPRCGRQSTRYTTVDRVPVCSHAYHDAADCGVCGECRNGTVVDASGRVLSTWPQSLPLRPDGPWRGNHNNTTGE